MSNTETILKKAELISDHYIENEEYESFLVVAYEGNDALEEFKELWETLEDDEGPESARDLIDYYKENGINFPDILYNDVYPKIFEWDNGHSDTISKGHDFYSVDQIGQFYYDQKDRYDLKEEIGDRPEIMNHIEDIIALHCEGSEVYTPSYICPECYEGKDSDERLTLEQAQNYQPKEDIICPECGAVMEFDDARSFED